MRRWQKVATTIWSTLLAAPLIWFGFAFWQLECGELDPCPTGGRLPYAWLGLFGFVAMAIVQAAFLFMIWRRVPEVDEE